FSLKRLQFCRFSVRSGVRVGKHTFGPSPLLVVNVGDKPAPEKTSPFIPFPLGLTFPTVFTVFPGIAIFGCLLPPCIVLNVGLTPSVLWTASNSLKPK